MVEDPGQVREELAQAREELAGTMRELAARADVRGRVRHSVELRESELQRGLADLAGRLRVATPEDLQGAVERAMTLVRRNPAPFGAAAAGLVVGTMIGRRHPRRSLLDR